MSDENMIREDLGTGGKTRFKVARSLLDKRDEAVKYRHNSGVERRWREDEATIDNLSKSSFRTDMIDYASGEASVKGNKGKAPRSLVDVNVIRSKVETAYGRFCGMMFRTDEQQYGFKPTPVPMLVEGLTDERPVKNPQTEEPIVDEEGNEIQVKDVAKAKTDKAKKRMKGMEDKVKDQLTQCHYNEECRKIVWDAVSMGTGVLKGPFVTSNVKKAWIPKKDSETEVHVLEVVEDHTPASKWVDFWNIYPSPYCTGDINTASYIWEYGEITEKEVANLKKLEDDGYDVDEIERVLKEGPQRTDIAYKNKKQTMEKKSIARGQPYEKWEYHGSMDREDLEVMGKKMSKDEARSASVCAVFINDRCVKIEFNLLDSGDLPYDFFNWCEVKGSPFGIGLIRIGAWAQAVIVGAWRSMMDNARDSSGANVIVGRGVEPADGKWELTGKKIWRNNGSLEDVTHAFKQFQLESRQAELQAIIEFAIRFLDMETNIPLIFQTEKRDVPETLGATNIMVDSSNIGLRTRVKVWDDSVTVRHITRYYDYNMQYADDPEIKGDFYVDARGVSVLLVRDQQAQTLSTLFPMKGDPDIDRKVDWSKAADQLFKSLSLDVLRTEEETKKYDEDLASQEPPVDPRIEASNIRAQGELEKAKLESDNKMRELEFKAQEAEKDRQHEMVIKELDYKISMMEYAQKSGINLDKIKADLAKEASKQDLMRELADKKENKTPEITKPPIEPPGKAPEGEAYQA